MSNTEITLIALLVYIVYRSQQPKSAVVINSDPAMVPNNATNYLPAPTLTYTVDIHGTPLSSFTANQSVTMPDGNVWIADGQGGFGYSYGQGEEPPSYA